VRVLVPKVQLLVDLCLVLDLLLAALPLVGLLTHLPKKDLPPDNLIKSL
jgi:hypothetical protein